MNDKVLRDLLPAVVIVATLTFGGSSSGGIWANAALQLFSALLLSLFLLGRSPWMVRPGLTILVAASCLLPMLQLVPLPTTIWGALPGRSEVIAGFDLAGVPRPWLALSLDRDATLAVLASLLPTLAALVVFSQASGRGLDWAMRSLVGMALGSMLLGLAQQTAGEGTALQPYTITNPGHATGLFANRNHLGTLLVMAMPCAVVLFRKSGSRVVGAGLVILLLVGAALTGSMAAMGLGLLSALVSLIWVGGMAVPRRLALPSLALGLALCAIGGWWFLAAEAVNLPGGAEQHRPVIIATTLKAASDYFPAGSGGGSFLRVYQHYEDPAKTDPEFRNHAHSDYAEVLLEYGAAGCLLVLAALAWLARRMFEVSRGHAPMPEARAGVLMLVLVLAHSAVDYPLRTAALAVVAALAAVLAERNKARDLGTGEAGRILPHERLRIAL